MMLPNYVLIGALFGFACGMYVGHRLGLRLALRMVKDSFQASELRRLKPEPPLVCVKCGGVHITMEVPIDDVATVECHDCGFKGKCEEVQP